MQRAQEHLGTLVAAIAGFLRDPETYSPVLEIKEQRRPVLVMEDMKEPPPEWGALIGDYAHNLRSALDHLAFQLTIANSSGAISKERIKGSAFPILVKSKDFWHAHSKGSKIGQPVWGSGLHKLLGVSDTAKAIIEGLQPYHRRKYPGTRTLWELEELWNGDKHRLFPLMYPSFDLLDWSIRGNLPFVLKGFEPIPGRLKKGAVIARWEYIAGLQPIKVQVDCHILADIAFGKGRLVPYPVRGLPLIETLYGELRFIAEEVIPPLSRDASLPFNFNLGRLVYSDRQSPKAVLPTTPVRRSHA
jgi:hypothetical protein